MNPFTANWGLSFTRRKFNIRINENYRGIQRRGAITGLRIEPGSDTDRPKRLYIDVTGEYFLTRQLGLFFALRNVGGATEDQKVYGPNTPAYARFRQNATMYCIVSSGARASRRRRCESARAPGAPRSRSAG